MEIEALADAILAAPANAAPQPAPQEYALPFGPWLDLDSLKPGARFVTFDGTTATKTERKDEETGQWECTLADGKPVLFRDSTAVCELPAGGSALPPR